MARLADLRSRAVLRTADELGIPHAHAVGLRELLYATAFQQADPTIGDERDVELTAGWDGERGRFVAAARAAGMIVEADHGVFVLPDFDEAAPAWSKKRAQRAEGRKATGKTISDLRSEAGLKGAASRASKREASGRRLNPTRKQTAPLPSSLPSLLPTDQTEKLRSFSLAGIGSGGEGFARFWRGYPRKVQKGDALKAWKAIKGSDRALALTAVSAYAIAWERAPEEQRKFIPYPATWLRAGQWADDPEEWRRAAAARQGTSGAPGRSQRPSITPPGFRAEDELPGTSKLDCLTVEEIGDPEPPPSPPPAPAGGGVWPAILERLRGVVDERDFDTWFRPTRQSGEVNGTLRVVVASELFRRDVPREYGDALRSACVAEGVNVPIEFIVNRGEP